MSWLDDNRHNSAKTRSRKTSSLKHFYSYLSSVYEELKGFLDEQYLKEIFAENAKNIIKNKPLVEPKFTPLKKGLFGLK